MIQTYLLSANLILVSLVLLALTLLIARRNKDLGLPILLIGFLLKIAAGIVFIEIYSNHYGSGTLSADAQKFMSESKVMNEVFSTSKSDYFKLLFGWDIAPEQSENYLKETHHWDTNSQLLFNDNRNLMRIHSVIHFFSANSIYVHLIVFAFFSFLSTLILTRSLRDYLSLDQRMVFLALLVIPSVLFWSSSVLKEPLLFLGISLILYGLLRKSSLFLRSSALLAGTFLVLFFKPYVIVCMLPAALLYWLYSTFKFKIFMLLTTASTGLVIAFLLLSSTGQRFAEKLSRKQFDFLNISQGGAHLLGDNSFYYLTPEQLALSDKIEDTLCIKRDLVALRFDYSYTYAPKPIELKKNECYTVFFQGEVSDSYIATTPINKDPLQLIKNIPESIVNVLFRPFPGDPGSWLKYPAMLETWILMFLLVLLIRNVRKVNRKQAAIIISLLVFIITLSILIGWVTPVLGAINRYRTPVILAIGILILILWSANTKPQKS